MSAKVTFNNCTFNTLSSLKTAVFAFSETDTRATLRFYINNCTFNVGNKMYSMFSTGADTPRSICFDENTKVTIVNTVDVSAVTELTEDKVLLGLRKTGADDTNSTYQFTPFAITNAFLNITNDLNFVYRVFLPAGYENPSATFTVDEHTITVTEYTVDENGLYCFKLSAIGPHRMGDTVTASVTATYKGATETVTNSTLSVKSYIDIVRAQNADNETLIALLDALLVYGANAQVYMGHNTDNLVGTLGELSEVPAGEIVKNGTANADFQIVGAGLRLGGAFDFGVQIKAADLTGLTLKITKGGVDTVVTLTEDMKNGEYYVVYYNGLIASELDENVTFTLVQNGEQVGKSLTLTANAYLAALQTSTNANLANLTKALYAYGVAANAFAN